MSSMFGSYMGHVAARSGARSASTEFDLALGAGAEELGIVPASVLDAMTAADGAFARMARVGQTVHFAERADGQLRIELQAADGTTIRTLSLAETLALACGDESVRD